MVFCCGNNDAKYNNILIVKRKGVIMDQSGMYAHYMQCSVDACDIFLWLSIFIYGNDVYYVFVCALYERIELLFMIRRERPFNQRDVLSRLQKVVVMPRDVSHVRNTIKRGEHV